VCKTFGPIHLWSHSTATSRRTIFKQSQSGCSRTVYMTAMADRSENRRWFSRRKIRKKSYDRTWQINYALMMRPQAESTTPQIHSINTSVNSYCSSRPTYLRTWSICGKSEYRVISRERRRRLIDLWIEPTQLNAQQSLSIFGQLSSSKVTDVVPFITMVFAQFFYDTSYDIHWIDQHQL